MHRMDTTVRTRNLVDSAWLYLVGICLIWFPCSGKPDKDRRAGWRLVTFADVPASVEQLIFASSPVEVGVWSRAFPSLIGHGMQLHQFWILPTRVLHSIFCTTCCFLQTFYPEGRETNPKALGSIASGESGCKLKLGTQTRLNTEQKSIWGLRKAIIIFSPQDFVCTGPPQKMKCFTPADESDQHHNITWCFLPFFFFQARHKYAYHCAWWKV